MLKLILKLFIILFLTAFKLIPQQNNIEFTHLTVRDGLSLSVITEVIQDKHGFMWFGTYNGLNRYDGYNFRVFLPEPSNPNSISNHSIAALYEDSQGYIWIGTQNGLNRYDWRTEKFKRYFFDPSAKSSLSNNNVLSVYEDKTGTLWIGTLNGLNKYDRQKDNFTVIKKVTGWLNPDSLNSVITITEDMDGIMWLGTWNGLSCMKKDGTVIKQHFQEPADSKNFNYRKISCLYVDKMNDVWIGTNGKGLKKYNRRTNSFEDFVSNAFNPNSLSYDYISVIFEDKKDNLWIGTADGLNKFDRQTKTFTRIFHDRKRPLSLAGNEVFSICQDNTGLIWVGSGGGVSRFYEPKNKFNYYQESSAELDYGLISNRVNSLHISRNGTLWIGTFEGLDEIRKGSKKVIHHRRIPGDKNSLSSNFIMSTFEDSKGNIWVGTNDDGLNRYDPVSGTNKIYTYDITDTLSISNKGIISVCEDSNGDLWFGTWWGLNKFDRKTEKFLRYRNNPSDPSTLKNDLIWAIFEDSRGILWIGTDGGGVSRFNRNKGTFTNFVYDSSKGNNICGNRVLSIYESSDGIMWFSTTEGLSSYEHKSGKFTTYNNKNGLPGNLINSVIEDNDGFLWIATDKGLSKFDRRKKTFSNYTIRNGLKELEFTLHVYGKDSDGILYFGCKLGLMYFDPRSIKDEYITAPVVITDLKIYNQSLVIDENSILKTSLLASNLVELPYDSDVITFDFALLDYFDVKKNNFSYKLEGFDTDWNEVAGKNSATYTNLPPGNYIFRVKGYNMDGIHGSKETLLNLVIVPAFYQTWWFKITLLAVAFVFTLMYVQLRTIKIRNQNRQLEQKVTERTRDLDNTIVNLNQEIDTRKKAEEKVQQSLEEKEVLLKEIHHRVKNNLQVISSLLYLQSASIKDKETIALFHDSQNRIKSMALIHEKLYQSKDFAEVNFNEYVRGLTEHLNRSYKRVGYSVTIKVEVNDIYLVLDTAISCGLIVNELVTNAFKYAFPLSWIEQHQDPDLLISIRVENKNTNELVLSVKDNGIGLPENIDFKKINSLGLKLVSSMVQQLDGTLEIKRVNGTEFIISFIQ